MEQVKDYVTKRVNVFMDSIKDIKEAGKIRELVRENFPEENENRKAFLCWLDFTWCCNYPFGYDTCTNIFLIQALKNRLVKFLSPVEEKEPVLTSYITVNSFCSKVPLQNRVMTMGTFRDIMNSISQLVEKCAKESGFTVKSFKISGYQESISVTIFH